jgi:hypothetical protein
LPTAALAEGPLPEYNDGTDPARPARTAALSYEYRKLADQDRKYRLFADLKIPLHGDRTVLAFRAPFVALDSAHNGFGLGDIGITLSEVLPTGGESAVILGAQIEFNSASQPERGAGQTVATASMIIERSLPGGGIVAPGVAHSMGISGSTGRISLTRINLYMVPALRSDRLYVSLDPAVNFDWGEGGTYADVAVTLGYGLGRLMGGDTQVFARPSAGVGKARSFDWGMEIGFQLLNF